MRRFAALLAAVAALAVAAPGAAVAESVAPVRYEPPVAGPVADPFREPAGPYGPGNRGLDFVTRPGQDVLAAAGGEVTFAGQVGSSLHVVILHADGLRTGYSFLESIAVRRGDRLPPGAIVGTAGPLLHFGARAGDLYLDPATLFVPGQSLVHLVPVELRSAGSEDDERDWLAGALHAAGRLVAGTALATVDAVEWARASTVAVAGDLAAVAGEHVVAATRRWADRMVVFAHVFYALQPVELALAAFSSFRAWRHAECTEGDTPVPVRHGRRIMVKVGGLGSKGGHADVLDVDAAVLGYGPADVAQFSYRGGRVPGVGELVGVPVNDYGSVDSQGDLVRAGRRLRDLLDDIARAHPGVPVDIVAHSQGGVVARLALAEGPAGPVENLVTLGSPHHGADLATAVELLDSTALGSLVLGAGSLLSDLDPDAPAIAQLAETSPVIGALERTALPVGVRVTSIAASGDLVVPAAKTVLDGATNVVLTLDGVFAHGELPGSDAAQREVALALAGLPAGCRPLWEVARDALVSQSVEFGEDVLAAGVGAALAA